MGKNVGKKPGKNRHPWENGHIMGRSATNKGIHGIHGDKHGKIIGSSWKRIKLVDCLDMLEKKVNVLKSGKFVFEFQAFHGCFIHFITLKIEKRFVTSGFPLSLFLAILIEYMSFCMISALHSHPLLQL